MKFCDKDFLLSNSVARELYHGTAEKQPIIDYHCHLSPKDLAENRQFANIHEPWLGGDHYKWRAMRANGVPGS
jgi:glucuronate isomerase